MAGGRGACVRAERRAAVAEQRAAVAEAVAAERERVIEAQLVTLRLLETAPAPVMTTAAEPAPSRRGLLGGRGGVAVKRRNAGVRPAG